MSAATSPVLTDTVRRFGEAHTATRVEVVLVQQRRLHRGLLEGALDLGLVNYLEGDEITSELHTPELLCGRPVLCMHTDSLLAAPGSVTSEELATAPLIGMREGYAMHRYVTRLLGGRPPSLAYSADGAEMGSPTLATRDLHNLFVKQAQQYAGHAAAAA